MKQFLKKTKRFIMHYWLSISLGMIATPFAVQYAYSFINDTTCRYECTLSESELAGEYISEIGLYDSAGDIVCIKTFTKKGKDGDIEMTYTLDDVF